MRRRTSTPCALMLTVALIAIALVACGDGGSDSDSDSPGPILGNTEDRPALVAVNTIDLDGQGNPGITIGDTRYAHPSNGKGLQVLVIDRTSRDMLSNDAYDLTTSDLATLDSALKSLPDTVLVFVTLPTSALAGTGGTLPANLIGPGGSTDQGCSPAGVLDTALCEIGGVVPKAWVLQGASDCWSGNTPACDQSWVETPYNVTSFTVVGVPGMAVGNAWYDSAAQRGDPTGEGRLVGYLTPGSEVTSVANVNAYTLVFQSDQYVVVDTCASGGPSACEIQVGEQVFAPQPGVNGLNVVVLDRVTLAPIAHQTVTSTTVLSEVLASGTNSEDAALHTESGPDAGFITDGVFALEGADWNDPNYAVVLPLEGPGSALIVDLGSVHTICGSGNCAPRVQADRHPFEVDYSTDGVNWTSFGLVPSTGSSGLTTRTVTPNTAGNFNARYVRLWGTTPSDDTNYAISEVQLHDSSGNNIALGASAIGPRPYLIADGQFAPAGTSWNDKNWAVILRKDGPGNALVLDLGAPTTVCGACGTQIQADKNVYQIDYSTDGETWVPYATLPSVSPTGLQTRGLAAINGGSLAPFTGRYVRVWGLSGDGNYSVSEVALNSQSSARLPVAGTYGPEALPTNGDVAPEGTAWNDSRYARILPLCYVAPGSVCPPPTAVEPVESAPLVIDLKREEQIARLVVQADILSYQVDYLDSQGRWQPLWTVPNASGSGLKTRESPLFPLPQPKARYLRLYGYYGDPSGFPDPNYSVSSVQVITSTGAAGHFQPGVASDQTIVLMQTVGTGKLTNDCNPALLQQIDQLGGLAETFVPSITQGEPYALVGVASKLPWHGRAIESSVLPNPPNRHQVGRARGVLARDRMARYTPTADDPTGKANLDLASIVYQDPQPWPYAGNPAIAYIADKIALGDWPDIRSNYDDTDITWTDSQHDPCNVSYPQDPSSVDPNFPSPEVYAAIQKQLENEFAWVMAVRQFIGHLQTPFVGTAAGNSVMVKEIADQITATLKPTPTAPAQLDWLGIFERAVAYATLLDSAGSVTTASGLISYTGKWASFISSSTKGAKAGPGGAAGEIQTEVDQLDEQLDDQVEAHVAALGALGYVLISDAGKLTTVGTNLVGNVNSSPPVSANPDWGWTDQTSTDMITLLNASTESAIYSTLLPIAWPLYNLKPDQLSQFSSADVTQYVCLGTNEMACHPFAPAFAGNQFPSNHALCATVEETGTNEVWTFAEFYKDGNVGFPQEPCNFRTLPSSSLTDDLFSTSAGGAAAYPPSWYRETYNPPGHVICGTNQESTPVEAPPPTVGPDAAAYTAG